MTFPSRTFLVPVMLLVCSTSGCCKEGSDTAPASSAPTATASTDPGSRSAPSATAKAGTTMCVKKDGDVCIDPTRSFAADTPEIHLIYVTKEIPERNQRIKFRWIAEDVGTAAPKNTLIREVEENTGNDLMLGVASHYTMSTVLTKPTKGWPVGKYKVEIEVAGTVKETTRFTVTP